MIEKPLIIDVHGLKKSFGTKVAVNGVDLQVREGEIFGFLGPNGSGKTTTIRMLCGLLVPDAGSGLCLGKDILKESAEIKREVGYMTQRFSLYADLSIYENLNFIARLYDVPNRDEVVMNTISKLGLTMRAHELAGNLSGGWKQRLALSAALIHKPKLLLLDEPTAGVDPKARRDFWEQIHRLSSEEKITTLVSTHYMDEAERCHRLAYISNGSIILEGSQRDIIEKANLTTWSVSGGDLIALTKKIEALNLGLQTAIFGNTLHISGKDAKVIEEAIRPLRVDPYVFELTKSTLEDVFINLTPNGNNN